MKTQREQAINYFSQIEFQAFLAGRIGLLRLEWLALTGRLFTPYENEELRRRFESFFGMPGHEKTRGRQILETFWEEDR